VLTLAFTASSGTRAQTVSHTEKGDAHRLAQIRQWTAVATQNLSHDSVMKLELSGFSLEGGELSAYFAHDTLRKIDALFLGETGRAREEFYFGDDGRFYSMVHTDERYELPMSGKVVHSYRTRLSFDGERLIQWIDSTGRNRGASGAEADEHGREAVRTAHALVVCVKTLKAGDTCDAPDSLAIR
jgi:hypothetical protein